MVDESEDPTEQSWLEHDDDDGDDDGDIDMILTWRNRLAS